MNTSRLAWIDIETTDLDASQGAILEVGIAITMGPDLKIVALYDWQVRVEAGDFDRKVDDPGHPLWMQPEVRAMHEASGLLADCQGPNALPLAAIEQRAIDVIVAFGAQDSPMCGSSIHFDRRWLARHMPRLHASFHYRNFDASMYRIEAELCGRTDMPAKPINGHRALVDVSNSIDLARWGMHDGRRWRQLQAIAARAPGGTAAAAIACTVVKSPHRK